MSRGGTRLTWVVLTGLALRLALAWETNQRLPDTPARLIGDEPGFDWVAYGLLQGVVFEWPARTPVYPLFLAACYLLFGHSFAAVLYVQALVGAAVIPLTYLLARRFVTPAASLVAALLVALHPLLIHQTKHLYSEILYTPLLLVATLGLLWALRSPRIRRFAAAGALLAVYNLCRPTGAFFPALLPFLLPRAWPFRRRALLVLVYAGAMAALIAPWTYHNYRTHGVFLPLSTSGAALWQASPEYYHLIEQGRTINDIWPEYLDPRNNGGHDPWTIEGNRYFNERALASIRAEPHIYLWYAAQKLVYFWIGNPAADWEWPFDLEALRQYYEPWQIAGIYVSRLFPLAALVGLVVLRSRWREFLPLLLIIAYFMAVHAATNAEARYSEALHPMLAILIAGALSEWHRPAPSPRQTRALAGQVVI